MYLCICIEREREREKKKIRMYFDFAVELKLQHYFLLSHLLDSLQPVYLPHPGFMFGGPTNMSRTKTIKEHSVNQILPPW